MSSSAGSSPTGRARRCPSCSTQRRRASSWPRRSDGSATGGTRSSSASRPSRAWGLEIDAARRPDEFLFNETFHPTFLYEALWNLGAAVVLLILDRRFRFRPPALFALYIALYTGFRFYLETIRIDPSEEFAGLRVNAWVAAVLFVLSVVFFIWWQFIRTGRHRRRRRREPKAEPRPTMAVPRGRVRPRR